MNRPTISPRTLLRELKRRKVTRACVLYLIACWVGLQVADILFPSLGVDSETVSRAFLTLAIVGLPVTAIFSWFYEVSAAGISRTAPFVERRILDNIAPLDDRRRDAPLRGAPTRSEASYLWVLEMETGPLAGLRYGIDGEIVVGRSPECELTIPVAQISRQHARFAVEGEDLLVEDLGSANGTTVNGGKIDGRVSLNHQDKVEVLDLIIRVKENLAHVRTHAQDATVLHGLTSEGVTQTRKT